MSFWTACRGCGRSIMGSVATDYSKPGVGYCSRKCRAEHTPKKDAARAGRVRTSRKAEQALADAVGGAVVRGSGAPRGLGGDVKAPGWLFEHKGTVRDGRTVDRRTLDKLAMEASRESRRSCLVLGLGGEALTCVVLRWEDFVELAGLGS